jgi:hypothetical protein
VCPAKFWAPQPLTTRDAALLWCAHTCLPQSWWGKFSANWNWICTLWQYHTIYHTISIPQLECVKRSQASGFGYMLHTSKSHSTECLDSTEMSVLKQIVEVQVSCNLAVGAMHTLGLSEFSHPYRHWSDDGGYNLQHTDRTLITHDYTISCSLLIQSEVASKRSSRGALKTYCAFIFAAGFSCLELPLKHAGATSCIGQIAADSRTHLFKSLWYMS